MGGNQMVIILFKNQRLLNPSLFLLLFCVFVCVSRWVIQLSILMLSFFSLSSPKLIICFRSMSYFIYDIQKNINVKSMTKQQKMLPSAKSQSSSLLTLMHSFLMRIPYWRWCRMRKESKKKVSALRYDDLCFHGFVFLMKQICLFACLSKGQRGESVWACVSVNIREENGIGRKGEFHRS